MVMARPAAMADVKKKTGNSGEYQSGWSFSGTIRYSDPSEDWWRVERITPTMTKGMVTARRIRRGHSRFNFSKTTGENSRASTVVYSITHQATSNMTERGFHMTSACQIRCGCPQIAEEAEDLKRYPRNAVSTVGRMIGWNCFRLKRYTVAVMANPRRPPPTEHVKPIQGQN
jgi:hypothetical protein